MNSTLVSVIIPTYHDWDRLSLCIRALENQTYPKELIEIIIVNNASNDEVPERFNIPGNCRIIVEKIRGSYAARNAGIKASSGEVLAFTDSDCIPDRNWIKSAIERLDKEPGLSRVGGRVELFYKLTKPNLAEAYEMIYAFKQDLHVKAGGAVTANMISRRIVFEAVGLFNQEMFSGGDNEWGYRARSKGYTIIYAPEVIVKHPARNNLNDLIRKAKRVSHGLSQANSSTLMSSYKRIARLLLLPPVGEIKNIFSAKTELTLSKKIAVFFLRYYILLVRAFEDIKYHKGASTFRDS